MLFSFEMWFYFNFHVRILHQTRAPWRTSTTATVATISHQTKPSSPENLVRRIIVSVNKRWVVYKCFSRSWQTFTYSFTNQMNVDESRCLFHCNDYLVTKVNINFTFRVIFLSLIIKSLLKLLQVFSFPVKKSWDGGLEISHSKDQRATDQQLAVTKILNFSKIPPLSLSLSLQYLVIFFFS